MITTLVKRIQQLYSEETPCTRDSGIVGGHLHVVLDDGNCADEYVQFCAKEAQDEGCITCTVIASMLIPLTETQREAMYDNDWMVPAKEDPS